MRTSWLYKSPYDRQPLEEAGRDGGENHEYTVLPGTYDMLAERPQNRYVNSGLRKSSSNRGRRSEREVSFAQGKLVIKVLDSAGKPLYADSWLYKSPYDRDNPEEAGRDGGENHEYTVLPGTYDMLVKDPKTGTEQWLKEIVLEPGKTVRKEVSFAQGKLVIKVLDSAGNRCMRTRGFINLPTTGQLPKKRDGTAVKSTNTPFFREPTICL